MASREHVQSVRRTADGVRRLPRRTELTERRPPSGEPHMDLFAAASAPGAPADAPPVPGWWRLRLEPGAPLAPPVAVPASATGDPDPEEAAADAAAVAAWRVGMSGAAFEEALAEGAYTTSACLCCWRIRTESLPAAAWALRQLLAMCTAAAWDSSLAAAALRRDASAAELAQAAAAIAESPGGAGGGDASERALLAAANRIGYPRGILFTAPACAPAELWVVSTRPARRALRHLRDYFRRALGRPLRVRVVSSDPGSFPIPRLRTYAAWIEGDVPGRAALIARVRDWLAAAIAVPPI